MNGKDVTVRRVTTAATIRILKYLHLNTPVEGLSLGGIGIGPNKNACIAAWLEMPPFDLKDKILCTSSMCAAPQLACQCNESFLPSRSMS